MLSQAGNIEQIWSWSLNVQNWQSPFPLQALMQAFSDGRFWRPTRTSMHSPGWPQGTSQPLDPARSHPEDEISNHAQLSSHNNYLRYNRGKNHLAQDNPDKLHNLPSRCSRWRIRSLGLRGRSRRRRPLSPGRRSPPPPSPCTEPERNICPLTERWRISADAAEPQPRIRSQKEPSFAMLLLLLIVFLSCAS